MALLPCVCLDPSQRLVSLIDLCDMQNVAPCDWSALFNKAIAHDDLCLLVTSIALPQANIKLLLIPGTSQNGQGNLFVQLALSSVLSSHVQSLRHALQATAGCWHHNNQDTPLNVLLPVVLIMFLFLPTYHLSSLR
jgi:hypothetical protein